MVCYSFLNEGNTGELSNDYNYRSGSVSMHIMMGIELWYLEIETFGFAKREVYQCREVVGVVILVFLMDHECHQCRRAPTMHHLPGCGRA